MQAHAGESPDSAQEQVDQIYGRADRRADPRRALSRRSVLRARREHCARGCEEILGGIGGRIVGAKIEMLERVGRKLWKGKVFDRDQRMLRNMIEDFSRSSR